MIISCAMYNIIFIHLSLIKFIVFQLCKCTNGHARTSFSDICGTEVVLVFPSYHRVM